MHIKAPNTDTHINTHYFEDIFKVTGENHIYGIFARKNPRIRTAELRKCHFTCTVLRIVQSQLVLYGVFQARTFSAAAQLRNEGGLKASFASVSSVLRLVYWLVWLSCLTVFTCFCFPMQEDSQQSAAAQQEEEEEVQTYSSLFARRP